MRVPRLLLVVPALSVVIACGGHVQGSLPPVPVPTENPVTEPKRLLGKVLFWDEQLSSDDTVACGTCHRPGSGGADPRAGINPGLLPGTIDDVVGSPGIARLDAAGQRVEDPVFGFGVQVSARASPSNFGALWASELFWDGRAGPAFVDPLTGETEIASGGALEAQALDSLSNPAEMAKAGRRWDELTGKLKDARPLAMASDLPPDVRKGLARASNYPALFEAAFGSKEITPVRIAFAIASYERTLVADQTPWDLYRAGDEAALTAQQLAGWKNFQDLHCAACHVPPLFTNNAFFNIGLRDTQYDSGRQAITHAKEDAGDVKVPSLRNVGLKPRFMHTGEDASLTSALRFYIDTAPFEDRDDIPGVGPYTFSFDLITQESLRAFLAGALTDPRVAAEAFPFDRPTLASERPSRRTAPE
jgi:cytochrome c peroxidase